jgi:long-chain acyl-CoA synthetase
VVVKNEVAGRITAPELIDFCRARLTAYKAPRAVEFRAELPLSGAGKLLRRLLRDDGNTAA